MRPGSTAARYDGYWDALRSSAPLHPANRFRYDLVRGAVQKYGGEARCILDLGCGDGTLLRQLRAEAPTALLCGTDVSEAQVERNRREFGGAVFVSGDASAPNFSDVVARYNLPEFDVVVSSEVIEHVENDARFLTNAAQMLRSGGILVLTTQSGPRFRMDTEVLGHLRHYRLEDLRGRIEALGLEVLQAVSCGFPVLWLQKRAVEFFFDRVQEKVLSPPAASARGADAAGPSLVLKGLMSAAYWLMRLSPRVGGPQLLIVARKR